MDFIFDALRTIFFTKIIGEVDLYTILSSLLKYFFVFIVLYFIYLIVKLIFLDIKTVYNDENENKSYLKLVSENPDQFSDQEIYELEDFTSIGRDYENDLILEDSLVSRRHAIIIWKNDGFYIEDMKSSNGTFVNGEKIEAPLLLQSGDLLAFGSYQYSFISGDEKHD